MITHLGCFVGIFSFDIFSLISSVSISSSVISASTSQIAPQIVEGDGVASLPNLSLCFPNIKQGEARIEGKIIHAYQFVSIAVSSLSPACGLHPGDAIAHGQF